MKWIQLTLISLFFSSVVYGDDLISVFPLDKYTQTVADWIKPTDANYDKPLLTTDRQQEHLSILMQHYFGNLSPWNADYVNQILHQAPPNDLKTIEQDILSTFSNKDKSADEMGYGENFRPHSLAWSEHIAKNINLDQLGQLTYQPNHRAIAVDNLLARTLPTDDVHFYNSKLAGEGYPFDNLQMSSLWAGTPVYILGVSRNRAWTLVLTPDFVAWVKSEGIAYVNARFVEIWEKASEKRLAAITQTRTALLDHHGQLLFTAYVGSIFPIKSTTNTQTTLLVPVADIHQSAHIQLTSVSTHHIAEIPLSPTPHELSHIMQTLLDRPYGWGNMYFYNDCSAELKNLFTPFGIWLPRHSADQVFAGKIVDMSGAPQEERLSYLMNNGHPFVTIIYIGGHVVLFIGNYPNPNSSDHTSIAMTYQNLWGLSPNPPSRRAVIGKSVFFPLLLQYPEDATLVSLANKKYFQVSFLDETPNKPLKLDLRTLMHQ